MRWVDGAESSGVAQIRRFSRRPLLGGMVALVGLLAALASAPALGAETITQTFNFTGGEQTFVVPEGIFHVQVLAVGGRGGEFALLGGTETEAGLGAQVSGELSVTPGETLYVEVGGKGGYRKTGHAPVAGFNGGGEGRGGGGGASDVRTSPRALGLFPDTRLLVAGGGGGEGSTDSHGGDPSGGVAGMPAPQPGVGGGAGTQTGGGEGGVGCSPGESGQRGVGGGGFEGSIDETPPLEEEIEEEQPTIVCDNMGGGGGGGYFGGGGGGGGREVSSAEFFSMSIGGGGGGGSSLVPPGGSAVRAGLEVPPQVQISYTALLEAAPSVTGLIPNAGHQGGGENVGITGTGFTNVTSVKFGASNAPSFEIVSATSIIAVTPPGTPGTVHVTVANAGGSSATSAADGFTYVPVGPAPEVKKLSVKKGRAAGGTSTTITGKGFVGVISVAFGTTRATSFTVNSPTSITAVSPAGTAGTVDVTVTTPNGRSKATPKDRFTYEAPRRGDEYIFH